MKQFGWLENRNSIILYLRMHNIRLRCIAKRVMLKRGGIAGKGIAISFMFRDVLETPRGDPKIFKYRPASRFAGVTKKKALELLGLSSDSSVEDCNRINIEIEKY